MKTKLILILLLSCLFCSGADAQRGRRYRAAARRAALSQRVQQPAALPVSAAALSSSSGASSSVLDGVVRVEWVEFITPQTASVSGLYNVAIGFARGSREFCEILDLCGRLFPTDPTACINAAGVALLRGDAPTARHYLKDLMTDARAYNNIGLLYLLEGNRDKAEVYLQLATANGTSPGSAALNVR